jgi:nicotinic acid phosphoribosyltransferase
MMDEQRMVALSRLYIEERIAAAEKERLLRDFGTRRAYVPAGAVWVGGILVRVGRRLEAFGGAAHTAPSFNMRRAV